MLVDVIVVCFDVDCSVVDFGGVCLVNVGDGDISFVGSCEVVIGG